MRELPGVVDAQMEVRAVSARELGNYLDLPMRLESGIDIASQLELELSTVRVSEVLATTLSTGKVQVDIRNMSDDQHFGTIDGPVHEWVVSPHLIMPDLIIAFTMINLVDYARGELNHPLGHRHSCDCSSYH